MGRKTGVQIPKGKLLWERVWCLGSRRSEARQGGAEAAGGIKLIPATREVPCYTAGCEAERSLSQECTPCNSVTEEISLHIIA